MSINLYEIFRLGLVYYYSTRVIQICSMHNVEDFPLLSWFLFSTLIKRYEDLIEFYVTLLSQSNGNCFQWNFVLDDSSRDKALNVSITTMFSALPILLRRAIPLQNLNSFLCEHSQQIYYISIHYSTHSVRFGFPCIEGSFVQIFDSFMNFFFALWMGDCWCKGWCNKFQCTLHHIIDDSFKLWVNRSRSRLSSCMTKKNRSIDDIWTYNIKLFIMCNSFLMSQFLFANIRLLSEKISILKASF